MDRTTRAVLLAVVIGFVSVAGVALFLGFGTGGSVTGGVVAGVLSGALLWGVSRRADSFHPMSEALPDDEPDDPDGHAPR